MPMPFSLTNGTGGSFRAQICRGRGRMSRARSGGGCGGSGRRKRGVQDNAAAEGRRMTGEGLLMRKMVEMRIVMRRGWREIDYEPGGTRQICDFSSGGGDRRRGGPTCAANGTARQGGRGGGHRGRGGIAERHHAARPHVRIWHRGHRHGSARVRGGAHRGRGIAVLRMIRRRGRMGDVVVIYVVVLEMDE